MRLRFTASDYVRDRLQCIDQIDRRVEPHPLGVPGDACHSNRGSQMRLARARATDQHHIVHGLGERQVGQLLNQRPIHLGLAIS